MPNVIENAELMRNQTWGSEWEMSNITCEQAVHVVAQHYGTLDTIRQGRDWAHRVGCNDSKGRTWWAHVDSSVASYGRGCCELVTPIMEWDDIEDAQQILRELRADGAVSGQRYGCGLHIHVGAFNVTDNSGNIQTAKSLRNLANLMKSHEDLLIKAINISNSRCRNGGYASVLSDDFVRALNAQRPNNVRAVQNLYSDYGSRYQMLNYDSLDDNKTVEFRLFEFHNKIHAGEFKAYLHLCLAMASYAKLVNRCSPEHVDMSNEKYAMNSWLKNMGLIGSEFKTTRKMLTKRLSGDTAYRHGRPVENTDDLDDLALDSMID